MKIFWPISTWCSNNINTLLSINVKSHYSNKQQHYVQIFPIQVKHFITKALKNKQKKNLCLLDFDNDANLRSVNKARCFFYKKIPQHYFHYQNTMSNVYNLYTIFWHTLFFVNTEIQNKLLFIYKHCLEWITNCLFPLPKYWVQLIVNYHEANSIYIKW